MGQTWGCMRLGEFLDQMLSASLLSSTLHVELTDKQINQDGWQDYLNFSQVSGID
jgi:hypothetical protein